MKHFTSKATHFLWICFCEVQISFFFFFFFYKISNKSVCCVSPYVRVVLCHITLCSQNRDCSCKQQQPLAKTMQESCNRPNVETCSGLYSWTSLAVSIPSPTEKPLLSLLLSTNMKHIIKYLPFFLYFSHTNRCITSVPIGMVSC